LNPSGSGGKPAPAPAPTKTTAPLNWDGTYTADPTTVTCTITGVLPDGTPVKQPPTTQSGPSSTFVISGNTAPGGVVISPGGQATFSVPSPGGPVNFNLSFVRDAKGGVRYTGSANSVLDMGSGLKTTCSGAVSGKRN
jgi:hypothetical protein